MDGSTILITSHQRPREFQGRWNGKKNIRAGRWKGELWNVDYWTWHGWYIYQFIASLIMWLPVQDLHKLKVVKLLLWKGEVPLRPSPYRRAMGSWWLLKVWESLSFAEMATGMSILCGYTYAKHCLDMGVINTNHKILHILRVWKEDLYIFTPKYK